MFGFDTAVHLTIRRHWLSVRVVPRRGEAVQAAGIAQAAMHQTSKSVCVAIGEEAAAFAEARDVVITNAFCHPRILIAGFDDALIVVRGFLQRAFDAKKIPSHFRLTIYVPGDLEGGLTDIEERALIELGMRLGGHNVTVQRSAGDQQK